MMTKSKELLERRVAAWLRQGVSPQRLAFSLSLGFAIGCIPVMGVTTTLCVITALALRLKFPVVQAANWSVMPLQVALIVPFVHLGERLSGFSSSRAIELRTFLHTSPLEMISRMGGLAGHALLAWFVIAVPAVALMTTALTALLRRVPVMNPAQAGD